MNAPEMLPGNRFRVYRSTADAAGPYAFLCLVSTKTITRSKNYSEAMRHDCDTPNALPTRGSVPIGEIWNASISGIASPSHMPNIRADFAATSAVWYRFVSDPEGGNGAGYYQGAVHFESLEEGSSDFASVNFSASLRGENAPVWTDGLPA